MTKFKNFTDNQIGTIGEPSKLSIQKLKSFLMIAEALRGKILKHLI